MALQKNKKTQETLTSENPLQHYVSYKDGVGLFFACFTVVSALVVVVWLFICTMVDNKILANNVMLMEKYGIKPTNQISCVPQKP